MIQIFGTPKCKATRAAQRFFAERKIPVQQIDLREKGLSRGELDKVARSAGGLRALVDIEGKRWRETGPRFAAPTEAQLQELLLADPLLLRTPIVRSGTHAAVGDDPGAWKALADSI